MSNTDFMGGFSRQPYSLEAEQAILGSVIIDPKCLNDIALSIKPEYFYLPEIYRIADIINRHLTQVIAAQRPAEKVLAELDQEVNELLRLGGWQL